MNISLDTVIPLLHESSFGVLATQSTQLPGYPFASILPFVPDECHRPVFLVSGLAEHTKNLQADARASLLVSSADTKRVLTGARLTIVGDVEPAQASPDLMARYLRYQPDAKKYLDLGDFSFFRLTPKSARYIAGFAEMGWLEADDWGAAAVLPLADEAALYREVMEVLPMGIRLLGLDCYGADIERQGKRERQEFPNGPVAVENAIDVMKRFFAAL
ncbi:MAG: pyridoxamine 5'-phosphate oxidase family protein [Pseudomonadota bacterium]